MKDYLGQFGAVEVADTSNFQRVIGKRLTASWNTIPHVTHNDDFDVTALEAFRASFGPDRKISPLIFLIKALVVALQQFPQFNSSLSEDGKELIRKRYFNISIAVDGPLGLLVPVLRDADRKTVDELAAELLGQLLLLLLKSATNDSICATIQRFLRRIFFRIIYSGL